MQNIFYLCQKSPRQDSRDMDGKRWTTKRSRTLINFKSLQELTQVSHLKRSKTGIRHIAGQIHLQKGEQFCKIFVTFLHTYFQKREKYFTLMILITRPCNDSVEWKYQKQHQKMYLISIDSHICPDFYWSSLVLQAVQWFLVCKWILCGCQIIKSYESSFLPHILLPTKVIILVHVQCTLYTNDDDVIVSLIYVTL